MTGNTAQESFTITVQDTTAPDVEITEAVDSRDREIADGGTTNLLYVEITFELLTQLELTRQNAA